MDQQRITALIELMASNDLVELDIVEKGCSLKLFRDSDRVAGLASTAPLTPATPSTPSTPLTPAAPPASGTTIASSEAVADEPAQGSEVVCAPFYGVLHLTPAPNQPPFVRVGETVEAGQTLGLLEAMKMFHSITAACRGTLQAILSEPGQEVDADQPLFRIS